MQRVYYEIPTTRVEQHFLEALLTPEYMGEVDQRTRTLDSENDTNLTSLFILRVSNGTRARIEALGIELETGSDVKNKKRDGLNIPEILSPFLREKILSALSKIPNEEHPGALKEICSEIKKLRHNIEIILNKKSSNITHIRNYVELYMDLLGLSQTDLAQQIDVTQTLISTLVRKKRINKEELLVGLSQKLRSKEGEIEPTFNVEDMGDQVQKYMDVLNLSKQQVVAQSGVSPNYLAKVLKGEAVGHRVNKKLSEWLNKNKEEFEQRLAENGPVLRVEELRRRVPKYLKVLDLSYNKIAIIIGVSGDLICNSLSGAITMSRTVRRGLSKFLRDNEEQFKRRLLKNSPVLSTEEIRTKLREYMEVLSLSQKQVALKVGVPQISISRVIRGVKVGPKILLQLSEWLNKNKDEFEKRLAEKGPVLNAEKIRTELKKYMEVLGLYQEQVALKVGVSKKSISRVLNGGKVSLVIGSKLSEWLNKNKDEFEKRLAEKGPMLNAEEIRTKLREYMDVLSLSQKQVALKVGVSQSSISRILKGRKVGSKVLLRLSEGLRE